MIKLKSLCILMTLELLKRTYPLVVKINGEYYTHPYFMDDKQNIAGFEYPGTLSSVKIKLGTFIISMIFLTWILRLVISRTNFC